MDHEKLFGTDDVLSKLGNLISNGSGDWVISLFGEGGTGKTTLAYEAVERFSRSAGFERVAWVSAKVRHLAKNGEIAENSSRTGWRNLLFDIADQLSIDVTSSTVLVENQVRAGLAGIAESQRCLVVIDNLETLQDTQRLVDFFAHAASLRPHKFLITTRSSAGDLSDYVREIRWPGLGEQASREFAEYLAADSGLHLSQQDVAALTGVSQGVPLIIKMAVRLAAAEARPVSTIVASLSNPEDARGSALGTFLYRESMESLAGRVGEAAALSLMNVFCAIPPGDTCDLTRFQRLSGLDASVFEEARVQAHRLALIRGFEGFTKFSVHPLLRGFVCQDS